MSNMPIGSYIQKESVLHSMGAFKKFLFFLILLIMVVMTNTLQGYAVMLAITLGLIWLSKLPIKQVASPIIHLWSFFVVIFIMNTLFFETEEVLWRWWIFSISTDGMMQGANVVLRVIIVMALSSVLMATTSPVELINAVSALLTPLRWIGVPTDDVAMILGVSIQFIPTLIEETDMIKKAQIARGAGFESKHLRDRAASTIPLIIPVFVSAFRRADELATAMEARGYRAEKRKENVFFIKFNTMQNRKIGGEIL